MNNKITWSLIIVNILVFSSTTIIGNSMYDKYALHDIASNMFEFHQLITHMFLHNGFLHLLLNMFALYQFGPPLENLWGYKKFLIFYLVCGIGSMAFFMLLQSSPFIVVGASGAIYGLVAAYITMYPNQKLSIIFLPWWGFRAVSLFLFVIGIELLLAIIGINDGIAHWGHIGGAITGFLLFIFWLKSRKIRFVEKYIFKKEDYIEAKSIANKILGYQTDVSFDKRAYLTVFKDRIILIDVSVYTASNMVWRGDLDMSEAVDKLKLLSETLKSPIYVSKDVIYKRDYIYRVSSYSASYQISFLNKYRNKL